jgi:hypothetical protein
VKRKAKGGASGAERGARGYGQLKIGPRAVGQFAQVGDGDKLKQQFNTQLEGDEVL